MESVEINFKIYETILNLHIPVNDEELSEALYIFSYLLMQTPLYFREIV